MPAIAVKPDGTQLFVSWYDRRNDTNNSLMDLFGGFGAISTNGMVQFDSNIKVTTTNFPPVFSGTTQTNPGQYDPVWPPSGQSLYWHYGSNWLYASGASPTPTGSTYRDHVGEYNGAWADESYVYLTWTDYRHLAFGTITNRYQPDIGFVKIAWP